MSIIDKGLSPISSKQQGGPDYHSLVIALIGVGLDS